MRFFIKMCVSPLDLWSLDLSKNAYGEQTNKRTKMNVKRTKMNVRVNPSTTLGITLVRRVFVAGAHL